MSVLVFGFCMEFILRLSRDGCLHLGLHEGCTKQEIPVLSHFIRDFRVKPLDLVSFHCSACLVCFGSLSSVSEAARARRGGRGTAGAARRAAFRQRKEGKVRSHGPKVYKPKGSFHVSKLFLVVRHWDKPL